jgi:hydrogenase/urease accessory protein HupE
MNKGDIKTTLIMTVYILFGIFCGYELERFYPHSHNNNVIYVLGFIIGICMLNLILIIWSSIRLNIKD